MQQKGQDWMVEMAFPHTLKEMNAQGSLYTYVWVKGDQNLSPDQDSLLYPALDPVPQHYHLTPLLKDLSSSMTSLIPSASISAFLLVVLFP